MDLQPGDIILFKGNGIVSKFVKFFTRSEYTHVAMMVSDTKMIEANWNKKVNVVDFIYNPLEMEVYRYKNSLNVNQQISVVQTSYEMLNKYYDYAQIVVYLFEFFSKKHFNNPFNFQQFVICSELIDKSYLKLMIDLVPWRSIGNVSPDDLSKSKEIVRIF